MNFSKVELDRRYKPWRRSSANIVMTMGVEPICRVPPIAPSIYHEQVAPQRAPSCRPVREQRDADLREEIRRVLAANVGDYGVPKIWRQMKC